MVGRLPARERPDYGYKNLVKTSLQILHQGILHWNKSAEPSAAGGNPTKAPPGHGEVILLIDDEFVLLEATRLLLESYNYSILTANHGAEGVAVYARHKVEIKAVVVDMMMPVMNGPETIHALRQIDPSVKIIGMSGLGCESVLTKAGQRNVQAFLQKPFAIEELLAALRRLLPAETAAATGPGVWGARCA
jgi:CheY-like chemotaxis protein